jgi:hypothetical protein
MAPSHSTSLFAKKPFNSNRTSFFISYSPYSTALSDHLARNDHPPLVVKTKYLSRHTLTACEFPYILKGGFHGVA